MKPKVVILSAFLTPFRSGAEACAEEMPLRLTDQFDFTIVTARLRRDLPKNDMLQGKIPVIRVGLGLPIDKWLYPFLAPFVVRKLQPKIVHGILETFAGLALHFCKFVYPKAKRVLTLQTTNRSFLKKMIVRSPNIVTGISKHLSNIASKLGRSDVIIIPNGIDYDAIREACRRFKKVSGRILFVGRLEKMKGVDVVIRSFLLMHEQFPESVLHVVGGGSLFGELDRKFKGYPRIKISGALVGESLLEEYAEAEIFCALSRSEALGNVYLEAQAAGCAVVATNVGGIPEIVKGGVLVPAEDAESAANALQALLTDEGRRNSLTQKGVAHAAQYDWKLLAEQYKNVYRTLNN